MLVLAALHEHPKANLTVGLDGSFGACVKDGSSLVRSTAPGAVLVDPHQGSEPAGDPTNWWGEDAEEKGKTSIA